MNQVEAIRERIHSSGYKECLALGSRAALRGWQSWAIGASRTDIFDSRRQRRLLLAARLILYAHLSANGITLQRTMANSARQAFVEGIEITLMGEDLFVTSVISDLAGILLSDSDEERLNRTLGIPSALTHNFTNGESFFPDEMEQILTDLSWFEAGGIAGHPLWRRPMPSIRHYIFETQTDVDKDFLRNFDYWLTWFDAIQDGHAFDLELQEKIANIDQQLWVSDDAPRQIALEIQKLETVERLKSAINRFPVESRNDGLARLGIGGNSPPENMQIEPMAVRNATIIWAAVDELKAETEKEAPDKSAVLRVIETLGRSLKAILAWCAQKGDLSVDTLIKWGIPMGGAAVLANPKLVADVIEAAKVWVGLLP